MDLGRDFREENVPGTSQLHHSFAPPWLKELLPLNHKTHWVTWATRHSFLISSKTEMKLDFSIRTGRKKKANSPPTPREFLILWRERTVFVDLT